MLHGKMLIWAVIFVLVTAAIPAFGLEFEDGALKVELTKVSSELEKVATEGYKGIYEVQWGVFKYNKTSGWNKLPESELGGYTFTLAVNHKKISKAINLVDNKHVFEYKSQTSESFTKPIEFTIGAKFSGPNGVFELGESKIGAHVSEIGIVASSGNVKVTDLELIRWILIPWLDYCPLFGIGEKISTRLPKTHPIPNESSVMNTILQAKKAIDNSGVVGKFAASWIGVFGNIGFLFFIWGLISVKYNSLFPVPRGSGGRFIFAGMPGFKKIATKPFLKIFFGDTRDPEENEIGWVAYSKSYKEFLIKWRWVIVEMNNRINNTIKTNTSLDLNEVYLKVWRDKVAPYSSEPMPVVSKGEISADELEKAKKMNPTVNPDCSLADLYSGADMLDSLECDYIFKLGHKGKPTTRILDAGLRNMKNNGMTWGQASEEVDRAMEMRAEQEITGLRRKSMMEYLYFGAAVAPLLGLLGTVTGISQAFLDLVGNAGGDALDPSGVIAKLAPSINEALWTTVMGLIASILMLIGFHFMDYLFDVVQSKWSKLFVTITEDL